MSMVKVKNIKKHFGDLEVLKGIDLEVVQGEVVCIIGPSGSGKSTMLRCLNRLERISDGEIYIEDELMEKRKNDHDIEHIDPSKLQNLCCDLGMVFQNFNLFPHMTVRNNIVKTLKVVKKMPHEEADRKAEEVLAVVGLKDKIEVYPNELSGGQKQRVAIARALALEPDILLFDEPTSALDPELVKEVLDIIRKLKSQNITMLIVSHEMNFVKEISDRVVVLEKGEILETGSSKKIFENPDSERVKQFLNYSGMGLSLK